MGIVLSIQIGLVISQMSTLEDLLLLYYFEG